MIVEDNAFATVASSKHKPAENFLKNVFTL
jgi:hypothetical protein